MAKESSKGDPISRIAKRYAIDLLIVTECELSDHDLLEALLKRGLEFGTLAIPHPQIRFFAKAALPKLSQVASDERFQFVKLTHDGCEEILIGATHLYGRQHTSSPHSRHYKASLHLPTLWEAERLADHSRTILVGDFNMTPEEPGMVKPDCFGALMSWDLAATQSHSELQEPPRFFNPMWSLMGRSEAPGTYYWDSTDPENIFWLCLDGIIARHSMRGIFRDEMLKIITKIPDRDETKGDVDLFRLAEKHWKIEFSDHLPIYFELHLRPTQPGVTG